MSTYFIEPIREFIVKSHLDDGEELAPDTPLLDWAVIDSFTLVELLQFIEERFGISVPSSEVTPQTFATLADISALLERLQSSEQAEEKPS